MNVQIGMACRFDLLCSIVPWFFAALALLALSVLIYNIIKLHKQSKKSHHKE
ncbi:MAG: hypothetical protein K6L73_10265 [Cellvibrionaceae bacterium]